MCVRRRRWRLAVAVLLAAGTQCVAAHPITAHVGDSLAWTFDPWVSAPLLIALVWFGAGFLRLRHRSRVVHAHRASALWFLAGWLALVTALVTPLHEAGERSFAAHMLEHELLMLIAAPLLVMSRPLGIALWAFPHRVRRALAVVSGGIGSTWRVLTAPVVATALQAVALWLWHAPRLFDLALAHPGWHIGQHLSFLCSALLFWWAVLQGMGKSRVWLAVGCLFFTALISGALGALMAFSASPWYAGYASSGLDAFGFNPAEDQQLAGLLMWIPGGLVHAVAGLTLLARHLLADNGHTAGTASGEERALQ